MARATANVLRHISRYTKTKSSGIYDMRRKKTKGDNFLLIRATSWESLFSAMCQQVSVKLLKLPGVDVSATIAKTPSSFLKWPLNNDHGVYTFEYSS